MAKILIVEDDLSFGTLIQTWLRKKGFEVEKATSVKGALLLLEKDGDRDLILSDFRLPDHDGLAVLKWAQDHNLRIPFIVMTSYAEVQNAVLAMKAGATDYIAKPFDAKELVARVKAVLRRYQVGSKPETPQADKGKCVEYPGIEINLTNYSVIVDGHTVEMPPKELELLYFLASSPNQVFTREQLLDQIWGYEYIGDTRTVDVHIKRLREKIKDNPHWSIATVWGIGYKFEVKNP